MSQNLLVVVLRVGAALTGAAFFAMLLPVEWMGSVHEQLGLGPFPRTPLVDYLSRSVAALYGFHGVLLFVISTDVVRFRPLVWFVAAMNLAFGVMLLGIGIHAGLPTWWIVAEGPFVILTGVIIMVLNLRNTSG